MVVELSRQVHFSCGHRYYNAAFSEEKNREVFGSCYSTHGHGHNYILEAHVSGPIAEDTGMIINLRDLDQILKEISQELDHKFLNEDVEAFKKTIPTTENIATYLFQKVSQKTSSFGARLLRLKLYETQDLWVEITA